MSDQHDKTALVAQRVDPATYGLPAGEVKTAEEAHDAFAAAVTHDCNLLAPVTRMARMPPDHVLTFKVVVFEMPTNNDDSNGSMYRLKGGKWALSKRALDMLMAAANIGDVPEKSGYQRVEDNVWIVNHVIKQKSFDGVWRELDSGPVEMDLRDGQPAAKAALGKRNNQSSLADARRFAIRKAVSLARNRAIRTALALELGMTKEQIERPFVIPVLTWQAPHDDPIVRQMVAASELGLKGALYGPPVSNARALPDYGEMPDPMEGADREYVDAVPVEDEEPEWVRREMSTACEHDDCGRELPYDEASWSLDAHNGAVLCFEHRPSQ